MLLHALERGRGPTGFDPRVPGLNFTAAGFDLPDFHRRISCPCVPYRTAAPSAPTNLAFVPLVGGGVASPKKSVNHPRVAG